MFSTLRTRFGIPGVISVIALVFAMFGGAYAASNSSGGGKATASAKAKKGPRGPKGPKGDTGPAGPAGAAGAQGPAGANGKDGANGTNGSNGTAGASVTGEPIASGGACGAGVTGVKYTLSATSTNVCNGKAGAAGAAGPQGPKGDPWTAGGTLPEGATETGTWGSVVTELEPGENIADAPISFTVPLAAELDAAHVVDFAVATEPEKENCENAAHAGAPSQSNPEAAPGFLCVFAAFQVGGASKIRGIFKPSLGEKGAFVSGAILEIASPSSIDGMGGTFAVTAP